jgi:hypothetical protein
MYYSASIVDLVLQIIALGLAARHGPQRRAACFQGLRDLFQYVFADIADGPIQFQTKDHIQVAAGIGVDGENGTGLRLGQVFVHQPGDGGLASVAAHLQDRLRLGKAATSRLSSILSG